MNYPCGMIQDLLPLYLDGVCSEESKKAIEEHLSNCSECKQFLKTMQEADNMEIGIPASEHESLKAASFQGVKKKLFKKQLLVAIVSVAILLLIIVSTISVLKNTVKVVEYDNNVTVSMVDGDLIGRLQGSQIHQAKIKRVTNVIDGEEKNYLFFYVVNTNWDAIITGTKVFSECTLCCSDKGADQIDAVYYYTGDDAAIESLGNDELQEIINQSIVLWQK